MKPPELGLILVMGVAGSGKSTLAAPLAARRGWTFLEADEFHSAGNIERIRSGTPLTDEDRRPWLLSIRDRIRQELREGRGVVLACSALKEAYRTLLSDHPSRTDIVFLRLEPESLRRRLAARTGHFAGPSILQSQLHALEPPEHALVLQGEVPIEQALSLVEAHLSSSVAPASRLDGCPSPGSPRSPTETR